MQASSTRSETLEQVGVRDHQIKRITVEEEYKKNPDLKKEDIQTLRTWITTQPHLPQNVPVAITVWTRPNPAWNCTSPFGPTLQSFSQTGIYVGQNLKPSLL
uniref:Uncharacterized protein n=1 Tax=Cacopsylla melanoneura TaxID=428564 RepID=A0A8D8X3K5_9HEMI